MEGNRAGRIAWLAAGITVVGHLLIAIIAYQQGYRLHRDEFYYLDCARNLALGYVDHAGMVAWLAAVFVLPFGANLIAIRLLAGLVHAVTMFAAVRSVQVYGGGSRAAWLMALFVGTLPGTLGLNALYGTTGLDLMVWSLATVAASHLLRTQDHRWWFGIGAAWMLGGLTKPSIGLMVIGLPLGMALSGQVRLLRSPIFPAALGMFLVGLLPFATWQQLHDWPFRDFVASMAAQSRDEGFGRWAILLAFLGPVVLGILATTRAADARSAAKPWMWLAVFTTLVSLPTGKPYYVIPAYLGWLAVGVAHLKQPRGWMVAGAVWAVPSVLLSVPVLPPRLVQTTGLHEINPNFGEMLGWGEVADAMKQAAAGADGPVVLFADNYGQAGIAHWYARIPTVSRHNSHAFWHNRPSDDTTYLFLRREPGRLEDFFDHVEPVSEPFRLPNEEDGRRIYRASGPRPAWRTAWEQAAHFD